MGENMTLGFFMSGWGVDIWRDLVQLLSLTPFHFSILMLIFSW